MKILLFGNSALIMFKFRKELIYKLIDQNNEVYLLCPSGDLTNELIHYGAKHINIKIDRHGINPFRDLFLLINIYRVLLKIKPGYVFTYTIKPNIYVGLISRILRFKFAVNITGLGKVFSNNTLLKKFIVILYRISFKKANTIFVQNQNNFELLLKLNIYPKKLRLIPGSGVNINQYMVRTYPQTYPIRFLYLGRIMEEKGIEYFLDTAREILEIFPKSEFHICGFIEANYHGNLHKFIKDKIVIYHGFINHPDEIIQQSHCLVHPSYYPEGISNVILEASAMGRPVITSNNFGCGELVINNRTGYVYDLNDSEGLSKAIKQFLSLKINEMKQLGINARTHVESLYDRNIVINEYIKLVDSSIK